MDDFFKEIQQEFLEEAKDLLDSFQECCLRSMKNGERGDLDEMFRALHNIKGTSQSVELNRISEFVHKMEDFVQGVRADETRELSKEDVESLLSEYDQLYAITLRMIGGESEEEAFEDLSQAQGTVARKEEIPKDVNTEEGLLSFSNIEQQSSEELITPVNNQSVAKKPQTIKCSTLKVEEMLDLLGETITLVNTLDEGEKNKRSILKYINQLHETCLSLTAVSVKSVHSKLERAVTGASQKTGKPINFELQGEHVEIDKFILESLVDPLVHILRNSIDHGIEDEAQRMLEKKEHAGNVKLIFKRRSESVSVIVKDDGGGINPERIYEIAKEKKLIDSSTELSDSEKINLVLLPGFSTKEEITDLSGRGVGMDVVAKTIEGLHGSIKIDSQIGIGSEFCMNIPLSQSIFYGLISQVGEQKIIFRISEISRIVRVRTGDLESLANGVYHVRHEKRVFEVIHLKYFLNGAKELEEDREIFIVLTEVKGRSFGVLVDEIHNREKLVEKNIVFSVPDLNISIDQKCFSGVCLLSSSQIGSVLNLGGISQNFLRSKHAA